MSAVEWIATHVSGGQRLTEETLALVADFTLIWALFEGTEAHGEGVIVVDELQSIAERVSHNFSVQRLDEFVAFWSDRYIADGSTNHRFDRLNLTHRPPQGFGRKRPSSKRRQPRQQNLRNPAYNVSSSEQPISRC